LRLSGIDLQSLEHVVTGEISIRLDLTDTGSFKRTESRTVEIDQTLRGGYLYFFWQMVEAIQLERRRFGRRGAGSSPAL